MTELEKQLLTALKGLLRHSRSGKKDFVEAVVMAAEAIDAAEAAPAAPGDVSFAISCVQEMWDQLEQIEKLRPVFITPHDMRRWSAALSVVEALSRAPTTQPSAVPEGWSNALWRYGFRHETFGLRENGPYVLLEQVEMLLSAAPVQTGEPHEVVMYEVEVNHPTHGQPAPAVLDTKVTWSKLRHELALFCFGLSRNERAPNMEPDAFSRAIDAMVENGDFALREVKAMLAAEPAPAQNAAEAAATSAQPSPNYPAVPEGWLLVPKNATMEIKDVFDAIIDSNCTEDSDDAWRQLLPAAPQSAQVDQSPVGTFAQLRAANVLRQKEWDTGSEKVSLAFRGNELAGEVGELCNVLKKLERERIGIVGSRATRVQAAQELADVVICADLIAQDLDIDLGAATRDKFNATSAKYGLSTTMPTAGNPPAPAEPACHIAEVSDEEVAIACTPAQRQQLREGMQLYAAPVALPETQAARDVLAERKRQVEAEGWTPEKDDQYSPHILSVAAGCYALYTLAYPASDPPPGWPFAASWWKPSADTRRNCVKAAALLLAEIERIDRTGVRLVADVI